MLAQGFKEKRRTNREKPKMIWSAGVSVTKKVADTKRMIVVPQLGTHVFIAFCEK